MRPIIDAHLDLAWNAVHFDRNLLSSVAEIRAAESGMTDELSRGNATVSLPELRGAGVAVAVATLLARSGPSPPGPLMFKRTDLDYKTPAAAHAQAMGQLAYYQWLEQHGHARVIENRAALTRHWNEYQKNPASTPLGLIVSMEGADPMTSPNEVRHWRKHGLRAAGLTHYGQGQYASGTHADGPLTDRGMELLDQFAQHGIILDVTHLCDRSFFQAIGHFSGPVLASHHNCRALVPGDRQLTDEQIRLLIERRAVIGTAFDAWMLMPGWKRGESKPAEVAMEAAANHIDHICQLAGNSRHCGLGTDLDGGFGCEQTPGDLKAYGDLRRLEDILDKRGYRNEDIDGIFFGNWLRFFEESMPAD